MFGQSLGRFLMPQFHPGMFHLGQLMGMQHLPTGETQQPLNLGDMFHRFPNVGMGQPGLNPGYQPLAAQL